MANSSAVAIILRQPPVFLHFFASFNRGAEPQPRVFGDRGHFTSINSRLDRPATMIADVAAVEHPPAFNASRHNSDNHSRRARDAAMIVCSCNVLSDRDVRAVLAERSPQTPCQVYGCLACIPQCGCCARTIRRIIEDVRRGAEPV